MKRAPTVLLLFLLAFPKRLLLGRARRARGRRRRLRIARENGAVDADVIAAPERFLACPEDEREETDSERCMAEGLEAYETVYSTRLAGPSG